MSRQPENLKTVAAGLLQDSSHAVRFQLCECNGLLCGEAAIDRIRRACWLSRESRELASGHRISNGFSSTILVRSTAVTPAAMIMTIRMPLQHFWVRTACRLRLRNDSAALQKAHEAACAAVASSADPCTLSA